MILYRIKPEEFYILSFENGRGRRYKALFTAKNVEPPPPPPMASADLKHIRP